MWNVSVCFFIGVCRLLGWLLSVACGMYRYVFYRCVSVAWVVASWVGGCKENLDDIRAKPFQAIHKHILARKPHNCLLEIQDVPQSRNGSMGSMICSPLFSLSFSGLLFASLAFSGQSPKQPTHTHKKHTETFHKLPTTRLHPERKTIKNKPRR